MKLFKKLNQAGVTHLVLAVGLVVAVSVGFVGYRILGQSHAMTPPNDTSPTWHTLAYATGSWTLARSSTFTALPPYVNVKNDYTYRPCLEAKTNNGTYGSNITETPTANASWIGTVSSVYDLKSTSYVFHCFGKRVAGGNYTNVRETINNDGPGTLYINKVVWQVYY